MPKSPDFKLLTKSLESRASDEPRALGYLQRLNLAGLDVKGQLSTAYGQSGIGLSLGLKFDFGALLVPFVHLDLGASFEGARTAHSLVLLQQMPRWVRLKDEIQPPQPPPADPTVTTANFATLPYWTTQRPLAFAFLRGRTWTFKASALAAAWAGIGSIDDFDETGLAIGASLKAAVSGTFTSLQDPAPRHYADAGNESGLSRDVDALFDVRLKCRAAAWLLENAGAFQDAMDLDVPHVPLRQRVEAADASEIPDKVREGLLNLTDAYDRLAIINFDTAGVTGMALDLISSLKGSAQKAVGFIRKRVNGVAEFDDNKTVDLIRELDKAEKDHARWAAWLNALPRDEFPSGRRRERMLATGKVRRAQARELITALLERQKHKAAGGLPPPSPPGGSGPPPPFRIDIAVGEFTGQASAGAKVVLPLDLLAAKLALEASFQARQVTIRYQSSVPGAGRRALLCTQDTAITCINRRLAATGAAPRTKGFEREHRNLVTLTYRAVSVQWFDDAFGHHHEALPNGSGLSFGMSVVARSLAAYVRTCKDLAPGSSSAPTLVITPAAVGDDAVLATHLVELEGALTKQLRVTVEELRAFMRNAPSGTDRFGIDIDSLESGQRAESFLVESAFAFTAPVALPTEPGAAGGPLKDLFELPVIKSFLSGTGTGARPASLRLQVIRLRHRNGVAEDTSRSLFNIGWNPQPFGDDPQLNPIGLGRYDPDDPLLVRLTGVNPKLPDWLSLPALALEVGIGVERVRRAGAEGIIDLHQYCFPYPYSHKMYGAARAKQLDARNHRLVNALLVPPVALFSQ